ncbi:hypothetical protein DFQ27_004708 [Actinomortierella ambigua]|uniref:Uncharacterized protein n=1 Tax=Actinomortierella ambigua TaxID=1343610 RepID=A0A9P6UCJ2_9FUNG|nr:hypothetical protein DFQ27_004708 [Actinomortierella ambigua]
MPTFTFTTTTTNYRPSSTRKPRPSSTTSVRDPLNTPTPSSGVSKQSGGMSGGAIAGIVVGFLALLGLTVAAGFMLLKKRRRRLMATGKAPPGDPYGRSTNFPRQRFESPVDDGQQEQDERRPGPMAFLTALFSGVSGSKRSPSPTRAGGGEGGAGDGSAGGAQQSMAAEKSREVALSGGSSMPPSTFASHQVQHYPQHPGSTHLISPPPSTVYYSNTTGSPTTMVAPMPAMLHQAPLPAIPMQQQSLGAGSPLPGIPLQPPPFTPHQHPSSSPYATASQATAYQQQPVYYQPGTGLVSVATPVVPPSSGTTAGLVQPIYQQQQQQHQQQQQLQHPIVQVHHSAPTAPSQRFMPTEPYTPAQQFYMPPQGQIQQKHHHLPPPQQQQQHYDLQASVLPPLHVSQQPAPPVSIALASSATTAVDSMAPPSSSRRSASSSAHASARRQQQKQRPKSKVKEEKKPIYLPADASRPLLSQGLFKIVPDADDEAEQAAAAQAKARASGDDDDDDDNNDDAGQGNTEDNRPSRNDSEELVSVPIPGALELVSSVRGRVEQHQMQRRGVNDGARPREPVIVGSDIVLQPLPSELKRMNSMGAQSPLTSSSTATSTTTTTATTSTAFGTGTGLAVPLTPPAITLSMGRDRSTSVATPSLASAVLAAANAAAASFHGHPGQGSNGSYPNSRASTPYSATTSPLFSHPSRVATLGDALPTMGTEEYLERTDDKEEYNSSVHGEKLSSGSMLLRERPFSPAGSSTSSNGSHHHHHHPGHMGPPSSVPVSPPVSPTSVFNDKQELEGADRRRPAPPSPLSRPLNMAAIAERRGATPPPAINHATKPRMK